MEKSERKKGNGENIPRQNSLYAQNVKYQWKCYEHFRLMWMLSHGYTLTDLVKELAEKIDDYLDSQDPGMHVENMPSIDMERLFDEWVEDSGFFGEIWPCFREFMDCEFIECGYAEGKGGVRFEQSSL